MSAALDSVYVNLKILGTVKSYNKLSTKQEFFEIVGPQASFVPLCLQRWYTGENRQDAIVKIQELYLSASSLLHNEDIEVSEKKRLRQHVVQSLNGLIALQKTYECDPTTVAKLDVICDTARCILKGETVYTKLTSIRNEDRLGIFDLQTGETVFNAAESVMHDTSSTNFIALDPPVPPSRKLGRAKRSTSSRASMM
jgi:hypothetical protein